MTALESREEDMLRSVALKNAQAILEARLESERELVQAKRELGESRELLRLALKAASAGAFRWQPDQDIFILGENLALMLGRELSTTHTTLQEISEVLAEGERARFLSVFDHAVAGSGPVAGEFLMDDAGGAHRWLEVCARTLRFENHRSPWLVGTMMDVSVRKGQQMALQQGDEILRATFQQASVGIAIASLDGRLERVNQKLVSILGHAAERLEGQTLTKLTHEDDREIDSTCTSALLRSQITEHESERRYRRADGALVWCHTTVALLRDAAGVPTGFISAINDVSRRKATELELEEKTDILETLNRTNALLASRERAARSEAERAGLMKDEFLSTLSHELRTPLNAILGWSNIMLSPAADTDTLRRGAETIARNAKAQARLIEDLLDMNLIVSGKVRMDVRPAWLEGIVDAALEAVRPSAEARGVRLVKSVDGAAGPISGDPTRLQQIVWNLLSNAVKFTAAKGTVGVQIRRVDSNVELAVSDDGVGIPAEFLPDVFDRFRQADSSTTRHVGGLGLGLAIVKQLVELHGGSVRASSQGQGQGSTFVVSFPLLQMQRAIGAGAKSNAPGAEYAADIDLSGSRVLVVDDEPDASAMVKMLLAQFGAQVETALSGDEALEQLHASKFDLLISDIGMPGKDGYHLIRQVRRDPNAVLSQIPSIALTAFARSEDRTRAMLAGYQVHLSKPVDSHELVASAASLLGRFAE